MPPKKSGKSKATARTARQEMAETPRQPARRQETTETPRQPARCQETAEGSGSYDRFNLVLPPELADLPAAQVRPPAPCQAIRPPPPCQASATQSGAATQTFRPPPPRQAPATQSG